MAQSKESAKAEKAAERSSEGTLERKDFRSAAEGRKPRAAGRSRKRTRKQE